MKRIVGLFFIAMVTSWAFALVEDSAGFFSNNKEFRLFSVTDARADWSDTGGKYPPGLPSHPAGRYGWTVHYSGSVVHYSNTTNHLHPSTSHWTHSESHGEPSTIHYANSWHHGNESITHTEDSVEHKYGTDTGGSTHSLDSDWHGEWTTTHDKDSLLHYTNSESHNIESLYKVL